MHGQWPYYARDEQLPPPGDWRIWLFLGGRGAGKTRSGAEWIAEGVGEGTMHHIGLIGATHNDARAVMIEGVSGLLRSAPGATYEPTNRRILFAGGARATVLSADEPDRRQWVNAVRALVRPTLTIGLTSFLATAFFAMNPGDIDRAYVADSLVFVAVTSVVWWFGDRAPRKSPHR